MVQIDRRNRRRLSLESLDGRTLLSAGLVAESIIPVLVQPITGTFEGPATGEAYVLNINGLTGTIGTTHFVGVFSGMTAGARQLFEEGSLSLGNHHGTLTLAAEPSSLPAPERIHGTIERFTARFDVATATGRYSHAIGNPVQVTIALHNDNSTDTGEFGIIRVDFIRNSAGLRQLF